MLCPLKLSGFVVHQINASHKHIQVNRRECRIALYIKFPINAKKMHDIV